MRLKAITFFSFLCISIAIFGQEPDISGNEKQVSDSIRELILDNDFQGVLRKFNSLEDIDTIKLRSLIFSYSQAIANGDYRFNEFQTSNGLVPDMKVAYYGFRWATSENQTVYIIDVKLVASGEGPKIAKLRFVSYNVETQSFAFPGGQLDKEDFPPAVPPPLSQPHGIK